MTDKQKRTENWIQQTRRLEGRKKGGRSYGRGRNRAQKKVFRPRTNEY